MFGAFHTLVLAGLIFLGSHVLISSTPLRGALRETLGEAGYLGLFSLLAVATLAWFVVAFNTAPVLVIWQPPLWTHWVPAALMPIAAILVVAGVLTRNPTAVGQERRSRDDNPAPGILRITRHPMMWGIGLWGASHLAANGEAAAMILFGAIAVLALGGTVLIDLRKQLALGTEWPRLASVTSNVPFLAVITGRTSIPWPEIALPAFAGLLLYAVLFLAHPLITGMPVLLP